MAKNLLSITFLFISFSFLFSQNTPVSSVEYQALVDFYNSAGGAGWNTKWDINNNTIHEGAWAGVKAENGHVVEVALRNNNYQGTFPATFGNLRYLRKLDLGGYYYSMNNFSQANLDNLSGLESLQYLDLGYSRINATFPVSWAKLSELKTLYLYQNEFYGELPMEFGELKKLEVINFENNKISSIPTTVANLSMLVDANFSYNKIQAVNKEFEGISTLKQLNFNYNSVNDVAAILPAAINFPVAYQTVEHESFVFAGDDVVISNMPKILRYYREKNDFSALNTFRFYLRGYDMGIDLKMEADGSLTIPKSILGSMRRGDQIYLYQNSGSSYGTKVFFKNITISQPPVPDSEYRALVDFYSNAGGSGWYNKWDPAVNNLNEGAWYGVSVENGHIVGINLYNNNIRGIIPTSFSNLKFLRNLNLGGYYYSNNDLGGTNLDNFAGLQSLESIDLSYSQIKGGIPESWSGLAMLQHINLSNNQITSLFEGIGNLKELTGLYAYGNQISEIPASIGNAKNLQNIELYSNKIRAIPKSLESLPALRNLNVYNNEITDIDAQLPSSVYMQVQNQANYMETFEYKGADVALSGLKNITKYSRAGNDFSERNNFRLYLRDSDVGADLRMNANGTVLIPKQHLLSLKKGDKVSLLQSSGTAYGTRIYFNNVIINQPPIPQEEYEALVDFYNSANGAAWYNKWDVSSNNLHEGAWYGVSVENGHVVELNLYNNNLRGKILPSFGNLKYLKKLVLAGYYYNIHDFSTADLNNLSGLESLEHLDMAYCNLKQQMPDTWRNLKKLKSLSFYDNDIQGAIPDVLGSLTALENLNYYSNSITSVPPSISSLTKLNFLDLSYNRLTTITKEIESLVSLKTINLNNNNISNVEATVPNTVNMPVYYQSLERSGIEFKGTDIRISELPKIMKYNRAKNDFSEQNSLRLYLRGSDVGELKPDSDGYLTIPASALSTMRKGDEVYIYQTNGTAYGTRLYLPNITISLPPIPDEEFQALVDFYNSANGANWYNARWDISKNNLSEGAWSGLSMENGHITGIVLTNNNVRGAFPPSFKNLKYLKTLAINGYYNDLPKPNLGVIGELANLEYIDLNQANIQEPIPASWANLKKLRQLHVYYNGISNIDPSVASLTLTNYNFTNQNVNIETIEVGANDISYELPRYMRMNIVDGKITFDARNLFSLYVNGNYISQSFAAADGTVTFSNTSSLRLKTSDQVRIYQTNGISQYSNLNFAGVRFGAPIPDSEFQALVKFYEGAGGPSWTNKWNISENNLHQTSWYGVGIKNGHVVSINLPSNNLVGNISPELAKLPQLRVLNLQNNHLSGTLPRALGSITMLEVLDVNTNKLSGVLPESLSSLQKLTKLSVSNNGFEGEIPAFLSDFVAIQYLDISSNAFSNIVKKLYYDFTKTYIDLRNQKIKDGRSLNLEGTTITIKLSDISRYSLENNNYEAKNTFSLLINNISQAQAVPNDNGELVLQNLRLADIPASAKVSIRQLTGSFKDTEYYFASLKDGSSTLVLQEEYEALVNLYNSLNGGQWKNKWPVESNSMHISRWFGVSTNEGHVVSIIIPNNNASGLLPAVWDKLPYLQKLNISGNSVAGMDTALPKSIEFVADRQALDMGSVELGRDAVISDTRLNQYEHSSGTFAAQTYNLFVGSMNKAVTVPASGLRLIDLQSVWKVPNNQLLELRQASGTALNSTLKYRITFKSGDANLDKSVNIFDVQTTLNYILQSQTPFFNYGAADVNQDNSINVLDVIRLMNKIQTEGSGKAPAVQNVSSRIDSVSGANAKDKVILAIENGNLVMDTKSYRVASFEIILKNISAADIKEKLSQAGYSVSIKDQPGQVSIIAYSLSSELSGKIVLANFGDRPAAISSAMISDSGANEIPYEINNSGTLATGELLPHKTHRCTNYPNPFSDYTTIEFDSTNRGRASLEIFDMSGKMVKAENLNVTTGINQHVLQRGTLASGIYLYIIKLADNGDRFQGKIIVK